MVSMKLAALNALVAAIEEGSLRGAARRLGVSPPALTQALPELERALAAPLVVGNGEHRFLVLGPMVVELVDDFVRRPGLAGGGG